MTAAAFKQMWPTFINPPVRQWVAEHLLSGTIERLEIATNAPLSTLRDGGPPVPDDGLAIRVDTRNTVIRPLDSLPAIRDADMSTQIVGRTVTITLGKGVIDLPSGRRMTVANGVFEIPDTQVKKPPSRVRMRMEGPVPAAAELLSMERLSEASGAPLDPTSSRGTVTAQVSMTMPIDPDMPKGAVNYNVAADVANFAVDKFVMSHRIEAQMLRVTANQQGYLAKGDVRIGGMPAAVEYRRTRGDAGGGGAPAGGVRRCRALALRLRSARHPGRVGADPAGRADSARRRSGQPFRHRGRSDLGADRQSAAGLGEGRATVRPRPRSRCRPGRANRCASTRSPSTAAARR